jgi:hypothetical protein
MWFSTLAYVIVTLAAAAATLQPISSSNIKESACSAESNKIVEGGSHFYITTNIELMLKKDGEQ